MIAVADELRLLSATAQETTSTVLGPTHTVVHELAWCSAPGYEQYLAAACEDSTVQLWDLEPPSGTPERHALRLAAPVQSVAFHVRMPKLLLAFDASGVGRLIDWLASLAPGVHDAQTTLSFSDASALALHATQGVHTPAYAAWQAQDADVIGAVLGARWSVWQVGAQGAHPARAALQGTLGATTVPGRGCFAFAPTNARLFAVSTPALSPALLAQAGYVSGTTGGATSAVQLLDTAFPQSPRRLDVHVMTPHVPGAVDLDATGTGGVASAPTAHGVTGLDWLPQRVGAYDVLLVAVGTRLVPIPAS